MSNIIRIENKEDIRATWIAWGVITALIFSFLWIPSLFNVQEKNCASPRSGLEICIEDDWTTIRYREPAFQYRGEQVMQTIDSLRYPESYNK